MGQPSGDVHATPEQLNTARTGIYIQLKETANLVKIYGSLAAGIETLNMVEFIENQVKVVASAHAWVHRTEMRLLKELHNK